MRQSELSKQPIKILCYISEKLLNDNFSFEDPYDDYNTNESLVEHITNGFTGNQFEIGRAHV